MQVMFDPPLYLPVVGMRRVRATVFLINTSCASFSQARQWWTCIQPKHTRQSNGQSSH